MQTIKNKKFKTWMVFGTFDLFHRWHEFYISEAKKYCENLIAVIARDSRVLSGKWFLPNESENMRQEKVDIFLKNFCKNSVYREGDFADKIGSCAILWDENNIFLAIETYKPEILFFGYDQKVPEQILKEKFPDIVTMRMESYKPEKYKSSIIRKNM